MSIQRVNTFENPVPAMRPNGTAQRGYRNQSLSDDLRDSIYDIPREVRSNVLEYWDINIRDNKQFKYLPIQKDERRTRLLRLAPGVITNSQIVCELFDVEFLHDDKPVDSKKLEHGKLFTKHPKRVLGEKAKRLPDTDPRDVINYEALSWSWGKDSPRYAIMVEQRSLDGRVELCRKMVSRELALALKYLRKTSCDRILWIDQICIDQENTKERNHQVQMMSLIYTQAEQVCVWLGEDSGHSTTAMQFIQTKITKLENFDKISKEDGTADKWEALLQLMQRDWFSRRWVVQEIALARDATVFCGPDSIPWKDFAVAVELFVEIETATHRLSEIMNRTDTYRFVPLWFEHVAFLGASLLVQATAKIFRYKEMGDFQSKRQKNDQFKQHKSKSGCRVSPAMEERNPFNRRSLLSLEYLVSTLSIFRATEPRDAIYALLPISRDATPVAPLSTTQQSRFAEMFSSFLEQKPFMVDYSQPYADVCRDFVQFCIQRACTSTKGPTQALDILCRPWAPKPARTSPAIDREQRSKGNMIEPFLKHEGHIWLIYKLDDDQFETIVLEEGPPKLEVKVWATLSDYDKEEKKREDNRTTVQYFADAEKAKGVNMKKIKEQFPTPKHKMKAAKNGAKAAETQASQTSGVSEYEHGNSPATEPDEEPGEDDDGEGELSLPSWVAGIEGAPFNLYPHPGMSYPKMGRVNADTLVGYPIDGKRNYSAAQTRAVDITTLKFRRRKELDHYSLYVKGFVLDTVGHVGQVSQQGAIPSSWMSTSLGDWRLPSDEDNAPDPPDAFWRTIVADRGANNLNPPYYYARACKESFLKGGLVSGAVNTITLVQNEQNSIVAEFCRRVQAVIWNRAMIKTANGHLGLASEKVQKGDLVCILYGCTVPVILRLERRKEEKDLEDERKVDRNESLRQCILRCEQNRARRSVRAKHYKELKKTYAQLKQKFEDGESHPGRAWTEPEEDQRRRKKLKEDLKTIKEETIIINEKLKHMAAADKKAAEFSMANKKELGDIREKYAKKNILERQKTLQRRQGLPASEGEMNVQGERAAEEHGADEPAVGDGGDGTVGTSRPAPQENETEKNAREAREKADKEDPLSYYKFIGECYIHGMMDGEALREKIFDQLPDHVFELR